MDKLEALAAKNLLRPAGDLDVLLWYSLAARRLTKFLKGKEIAAKNWIPNYRPLLKRGSDMPPLFVDDLAEVVTPEFLELRKLHLEEARPKLSKKQELAWKYFVPRKLSDLLYATNNEKPGKPIERVFLDLDRGEGVTPQQAQKAAAALLQETRDLPYKHDQLVCWTGNSFHLFLLLQKPVPASEYQKTISPLVAEWAGKVAKDTGLKVAWGHEKTKGVLTLDPSQTPSGKLCRAPFSLHVKNNGIDGVDVPLTAKDLERPSLVRELQSLTPEKVYKKLDFHAAKLPQRFR